MEREYYNEEIEIKEMIFVIVKRLKLILSVIILTTLFGIIYSFIYKNNIKLNIAISFVLGCMLSVFIVFMIEYFKNTINFKSDVIKHLGLKVIGVIPRLPESKNAIENKFVFECINMIISNLNINFNSKVLTFTSSGPEEGTTKTILNIGKLLAKRGKKVVLLDCNLRNPKIHENFNLYNDNGLIEIIKENVNYSESDICKKTNIDNLWFINSGVNTDNPLKILESEKLREFIDYLRDNFDYILIDTPPVSIVTDALILSNISDGTILICASEKSEIELAKRSVDLLKEVKANIVGVILTNVSKYNPEKYYKFEKSVYYKS
ncbi:polysaccharide biosynthesis tyrosine autokinase [Anaerobranca gottschalkii]|uniref:non-specific protein-tyrosine kinase n=1 Tax=Anaerobranca gottschalkii DSM 13577 TaxID=1120990 RepID=A0A1H9ZKW7_9FIRM|nr:polysaccharide biosynthesis tyrosine autokinase [Anaerobranca gottschalkii]SES82321.1 capsular exopolysaccharide family [Anaerobranca gottschalkii DSM 13577]